MVKFLQMMAYIKKYLRFSRQTKISLLTIGSIMLCLAASVFVVRAVYQPRQEMVGQVANEQAEELKKSKQPAKREVKNIQIEELKKDDEAITDGQTNDSPVAGALNPQINTETVVPPSIQLPTTPLQFTQSVVTIPEDGFSAHVDVWADSGLELAEPQVTVPAGLSVFVSRSVANRWNISLSKIDLKSSGRGTITITTNSFTPSFKLYNGTLAVTW